MGYLLAGFTEPLRIGLSPWVLLWVLPLSASIAIVYKATKVSKVEPWPFAKETCLLLLSIVAFMAIAGAILCGFAWFVDEALPGLMGY